MIRRHFVSKSGVVSTVYFLAYFPIIISLKGSLKRRPVTFVLGVSALGDLASPWEQLGASDLISTDGTSASSTKNLGITNGVETDFTMPLTVSNADTLGSYEYTVVLTVLDGAG